MLGWKEWPVIAGEMSLRTMKYYTIKHHGEDLKIRAGVEYTSWHSINDGMVLQCNITWEIPFNWGTHDE